jgi:hypothetical protein
VVFTATNYSATINDNTIIFAGVPENKTLTLPSANLLNRGLTLIISNLSGTYNIVATPLTTPTTIEGNTSIKLNNKYDKVTLQNTATNLWMEM